MPRILKTRLTPLTKRGKVATHRGKGATEEVLPDRHALSTLTKTDPLQRTMNNYAKASPPSPKVAPPNLLGE